MNGSGQALPDGNMASGIAFAGGEQLIPVTIYANARNTEAVEVPDLRNARDFAGIRIVDRAHSHRYCYLCVACKKLAAHIFYRSGVP